MNDMVNGFYNIIIKYWGLAIVLIIIFFVIQYFSKWRKDLCNATENRMVNDVSEVVPNINYKMFPPEKCHHLFWTGGYDSTFRLCQLLILQDRPVQPIYIMCGSTDFEAPESKYLHYMFDGKNGRQNEVKELQTMQNIREAIIKNYPQLVNKLMPTHYVTSIKKNWQITKSFKRLHYKLGYFSRSINQYERMARFSSEYLYPIEVGLDKCGTGLDEATQNFRIGQGVDCRLRDDLPIQHLDLKIFQSLRFPIAHLSKADMKDIALKNRFFYILSMTWSCWFPKENGQPCGECNMCKQRIIQ